MSAAVRQMARKKGGLSPLLLEGAGVASEYSTDMYGWMDILVHTRLHQTMFRLLHAGLNRLPQGAALPKQAHPSFRPAVRPAVRPPVRPSICPFVRPSIRPSVHPSIHPSVRPSVRPSPPCRPPRGPARLACANCSLPLGAREESAAKPPIAGDKFPRQTQ